MIESSELRTHFKNTQAMTSMTRRICSVARIVTYDRSRISRR